MVYKERKLYAIRLVKSIQPCWVANGYGDPARTLYLKTAKKFKNRKEAYSEMLKIKNKYPHRQYIVEAYKENQNVLV